MNDLYLTAADVSNTHEPVPILMFQIARCHVLKDLP